MANYIGTSRTNYFNVKDEAAFKLDMAQFDMEVITNKDGKFGLVSQRDEGDWPSFLQISDEHLAVYEAALENADLTSDDKESYAACVTQAAKEEGIELSEAQVKTIVDCMERQDPEIGVWFPERVAVHLADGEIAVFESVGAEKARYVSGHSTAIRNDLEYVQVSLNDVYKLAKAKFGKEPSQASY